MLESTVIGVMARGFTRRRIHASEGTLEVAADYLEVIE
jgi:hypothetical protein